MIEGAMQAVGKRTERVEADWQRRQRLRNWRLPTQPPQPNSSDTIWRIGS